ncbi:hypothetical protein Thimo_0412 [Thioflavicoccus mobilis 8321]|uniref:Translocation and assembly module TamB C-terminal domain-containing protein n=1 Tax=Thioflavicoccus mobilis 8321 TaxID=765912 RepID=L0GR91_9GAMM|nr:translocation/assembly module TamB domain-containing protein [Thioflavicoccus mobilis]AGA89273.1 hypothetical protein Thimo_0412 [Thioflavicoccus mobilis 8321]
MTDIPAAPNGASPRRRRRWPRWTLALVGTLLSLALLLVVLVTGTQTGLHFALTALDDMAPGLLQVERADGRLARKLHLEGVRLRLGELEIRLSSLDLDWAPLGAITGSVTVTRLAIGDLDVVLGPSDEETQSKPFSLPAIALPIDLDIAEARLASLVVAHKVDGVEVPLVHLERLGLAGRWRGATVDLDELFARLPEQGLTANAEGQVELTGDYPLTLALRWQMDDDPGPPLAGLAEAAGTLAGHLKLTHNLTGAAAVDLSAELDQLLARPRWEAVLDIHSIDLPALAADLPATEVTGRLATSGDLDEARIDGTLAAKSTERPELGDWQALLGLAWRERTLVVETLELTEAESAAQVNADGQIELGASPPSFKLTGAWQGLRWPLKGAADLASPQGQIDASGTPEAFTYQISTEIGGAALPRAGVDLAGEGDQAGTRLGTLEIATLDGQITGQGELAWSPALQWDVALTAAGLDPGVHWPQWPGRLAGRLSSNGNLTAGTPDLRIRIESLDGTLRGYPVAASGQVVGQNSEYQVDDLTLSSGPSRLQVGGLIGERLDLDLDFASPDLASLAPDGRGSLKIGGKVTGTRQRPAIALDIAANDAAIAGHSAAELSGRIALGLAPSARLNLDVTGTELRLAGTQWNRLRLQGEGTTADHRLSLELTGPTDTIAVTEAGGLADPLAYRGQLTRLDLLSEAHGDWRLRRPSAFAYTPPTVALGPLCLGDGDSGGCIELAQPSAGEWRASLDIDRLDLARLAALLPPRLAASGEAQAKAQFTVAGDRLRGKATLRLPEGRLAWIAEPGDGDEIIDFSGAHLDLDADGNGIAAQLAVPLTGLGGLDADLRLADWRLSAPTRPDQPLRGRLRLDIQDLHRIERLVPDLDRLTGRLSADVGLAGTVANPAINGEAALTQAGFNVPLIGMKAREIEFNATASGRNRIAYQGSARIGKGQLDLEGTTSQRTGGWETRLKAAGTDLRVANTKEYQVRLSPDLEIGVDPDQIRVTGKVRMPEASFEPRSVPAGTVTASPDVVMQGDEEKAPIPLSLDVQLILGNQVTLDAFGVRGNLRGDLRVHQTPQQAEPHGDGQLQIVDGTYRISTGVGLLAAFGKPLTITQGRLIFADTPVSNPGLLLQAERDGGDLTAGVQILGTLREPKLSFFSNTDPGLTQAEITTYLITGTPPKGNAEEDNRSLSVGTYVTPKLYMEYVTSISDAPDKVRLRYELTDHVELQTETGEAQGGDIFFKFEN